MADVTITPTLLVPGTATDDLVGDGASVNAGQTFSVVATQATSFPPPKGGETRLLFIFEEEGSGAATVTIDAGDYPPSLRADLGSDDVALSTSDLKAYIVEAGRHVQDDGTITGSVATNDTFVSVYILPAGY